MAASSGSERHDEQRELGDFGGAENSVNEDVSWSTARTGGKTHRRCQDKSRNCGDSGLDVVQSRLAISLSSGARKCSSGSTILSSGSRSMLSRHRASNEPHVTLLSSKSQVGRTMHDGRWTTSTNVSQLRVCAKATAWIQSRLVLYSPTTSADFRSRPGLLGIKNRTSLNRESILGSITRGFMNSDRLSLSRC